MLFSNNNFLLLIDHSQKLQKLHTVKMSTHTLPQFHVWYTQATYCATSHLWHYFSIDLRRESVTYGDVATLHACKNTFNHCPCLHSHVKGPKVQLHETLHNLYN